MLLSILGMKMYKYYNPNPTGKQVGDCVIRGISRVTGMSWDETYIEICLMGLELKDMPSANHVWESYLLGRGFTRHFISCDACPMLYTVRDFCDNHPIGEYLLSTGTHVVAINNGNYYDAWDSGNEVPVYYWAKERSK